MARPKGCRERILSCGPRDQRLRVHTRQSPRPLTSLHPPSRRGTRHSCGGRLRRRHDAELRSQDLADLGFIAPCVALSGTHGATKAPGCDGDERAMVAGGQARRLSRSWFTTCGFALPSVAFRISPNRKPRFFLRVLSSPVRYSSTASAFAPST